jgi:hypothetical protein
MQIIPETMATKTQSPPIAPSIGIAKPKPTAIAAAQTRPLPIASVLTYFFHAARSTRNQALQRC